MHIKIIVPTLLGILLSKPLLAASGGGLIADNTTNTSVTQQNRTIIIRDGMMQGSNLLHSFQEFNVETGQIADFQAAATTQNIISRVTGANHSWIDGRIKSTTSAADLYLINPKGVMIGENARLDINGAFYASTADYITLADGQRLYTDANQDVTLTVAAPEAFGFLEASMGNIQITDSKLSVNDGQTIGLVGGEITLDTGAQLIATGGRIDLVSTGSTGEVKLTPNNIHNTAATQANITFTDSNIRVNNQADSNTVGAVRLHGEQLSMENSDIRANNQSVIHATGHPVELRANTIQLTGSAISTIVGSSGQGGSIQLTATDQIKLSDSNINTKTTSEAANAGAGGDVKIRSTNLTLTDGSKIASSTFGRGQSGTVHLEATDQIKISHSFIDLGARGTVAQAGTGGSLTIQAADITLADDATITAATVANGQGGSIQLKATNHIQMESNSFINMIAKSQEEDAGSGGNLDMQATNIILADDAQIVTTTAGRGQGSSIRLTATDQVRLNNNSFINMVTRSEEDHAGAGGNLSIQAADITLSDDARITAATFGSGQGGSVFLEAVNQVETHHNSLIDMLTRSKATNAGTGGSLQVQAEDITLADNTTIIAATLGKGQGGSIRLQATDQVRIKDHSFINMLTSCNQANAGTGGTLEILAANIMLTNDAKITAATSGSGAGGKVRLQAIDQVNLANNSTLSSEANQVGAGGDLAVQAANITLANDAQIIAATQGSGRGGSVQLAAANQVTIHNNSVIDMVTRSQATNAGTGGSLAIQAKDITLADHATLTAATISDGSGGSIQLIADDQVHISGENTQVSSSSHSPGIAGAIQIQATDLTLATGARIQSTSGLESPDHTSALARSGAAGQIAVDLSGTLDMSGGSEITTSTAGAGDAGSIQIGKNNLPTELIMTDGARITSGSASSAADAGDAGSLVIATSKQIQMSNNSALTTESTNAGGGGIQVNTGGSLRLQNSQITTSVAGGVGQGGNINIGDPVFVILENSHVQANAHGGPGGNITLVADKILRSGPSVIEASSALSTPGDVDVQAVEVDAGSLQAAAEAKPLDAAQWQEVPCRLRRRSRVSQLIMAGYDAHPTPMDDLLSSVLLYAMSPLRQTPELHTPQTRPAAPRLRRAARGCSQ
jgi:filamentous hemagglutinin family protein